MDWAGVSSATTTRLAFHELSFHELSFHELL
jgi:hypothetical protein